MFIEYFNNGYSGFLDVTEALAVLAYGFVNTTTNWLSDIVFWF